MIAILAVGFAMMTLGVALLCLGEVPLLGGKRIPAGRSRLIGAVLVSFLPLASGARQLSNLLFGADAVQGPVVTWSLCGVCWFTVFVLVVLVLIKKKERAKAGGDAKKNPFGNVAANDAVAGVAFLEDEAPVKKPLAKKSAPKEDVEEVVFLEDEEPAKQRAPEKKAAAKKPSKPAVDEKDPFDFS